MTLLITTDQKKRENQARNQNTKTKYPLSIHAPCYTTNRSLFQYRAKRMLRLPSHHAVTNEIVEKKENHIDRLGLLL